jgi:hypothetical protein
MKNRIIVRQGDVLLIGIDAPKSDDLESVVSDPRGLVLAEGETSGHHHAIFGRNARLMQYKQGGGRVVVVADSGADMRVVGGGSGGVDRHTSISLAPGNYEVRIQNSYTSRMVEKVQD